MLHDIKLNNILNTFDKYYLIYISSLMKFVIPSKENDEQIKSNLRTSIYCKIRLVANLVQDELRNKVHE